jgi:riboflavin synthase alpha subunit
MFTGIIREVGEVRAVRRRGGVRGLDVDAPLVGPDLDVGDSVAVNGVCLTVVARRGPRFSVDLSPETLRTTTASAWRTGLLVHLEPALRASDPLGGHFVLGHVDTVGRVERVRHSGGASAVTVAAPAALLAQLLPKGSISVDGVSLTLDAGPFARSFTATLIPETLRATRLGALAPGGRVNLEADVLAKAARRAATSTPALTVDDIRTYGWQ